MLASTLIIGCFAMDLPPDISKAILAATVQQRIEKLKAEETAILEKIVDALRRPIAEQRLVIPELNARWRAMINEQRMLMGDPPLPPPGLQPVPPRPFLRR